MAQLPPALHRTIVCVDVEKFTDRDRTRPHQIAVRGGLYQALHTAFTRAGIHWQDCYHEDRGDGALILVPPQVPKNLLTSTVPAALAVALTAHNQTHDRPARIRLRLALHAGEICHDEHGVTGTAINVAFRLLEAKPFKHSLAESAGVLAMIVSPWFCEEVIRHDPGSAPASYRRVQITVKETRTSAWLRQPTGPHPPSEPSPAELPAPHRPQQWPVPRQLPAAGSVFVGRQDALAALDALLADDGACEAVVISAIAGGAGVGKTVLAVHWAHQITHRFPDGVLFVNLRGYDPAEPLSPLQALDGFLRALDVPASKIPADLQARAALFRSVLAGRRILLVLDNAASAEQVRPLLPGAPGCLALITSRSRLAGLTTREGAHRVPLDVLPADQAMALLRQTIGADRVDAEPDKAQQLARLCGHLPLALRIAADRAAGHPHLRLTDLVEELTKEGDRLGALATGEDEITAVRAVFSWSYRQLPDPAARAFRLLGLHASPDIALGAAAALLGLPTTQARTVLDTLTGQHLLQSSGRDRYRFHDLLGVYAAERVDRDETPRSRDQAIERMLTWYLHTAHAADGLLVPHRYPVPLDQVNSQGPPPLSFTSDTQALAWFEDERVSLVATVRHAANLGHDAAAWKFAITLFGFLYMRWYPDDWLTVQRTGLGAAQRLGDNAAQALMLLLQGQHLDELGRYRESIELAENALALSQQANDRQIEGYCHTDLGRCHTKSGEFDTATRHLQHALLIFRDICERRGEGTALLNLGAAHLGLRQLDSAIDYNQQALAILKETRNPDSQAFALCYIGRAYHRYRRYEEAARHYREALTILRGLDSDDRPEQRSPTLESSTSPPTRPTWDGNACNRHSPSSPHLITRVWPRSALNSPPLSPKPPPNLVTKLPLPAAALPLQLTWGANAATRPRRRRHPAVDQRRRHPGLAAVRRRTSRRCAEDSGHPCR